MQESVLILYGKKRVIKRKVVKIKANILTLMK